VEYFDYDADWTSEFTRENFDIKDFLERSERREKQRMERELDRIETELEERDEIHEEALGELEPKLDWYVERLETLYTRGGGKQEERENLKSRITELYRLIREEKTSRWRDRRELEHERRELLQAIEEVEDVNVAEFLEEL
jgi:chromosome segregation ATPase